MTDFIKRVLRNSKKFNGFLNNFDPRKSHPRTYQLSPKEIFTTEIIHVVLNDRNFTHTDEMFTHISLPAQFLSNHIQSQFSTWKFSTTASHPHNCHPGKFHGNRVHIILTHVILPIDFLPTAFSPCLQEISPTESSPT